MTGAPAGAAPAAAAPKHPKARLDDLLFQESIGTISPQDAGDLGLLRKSGRLAGLEGTPPSAAPATEPVAQPAAPTVAGMPAPNPDTQPGGLLATPSPEGRNFADAFTERMNYGAIPGEAPNSGSLTDQLYRIANRAVGAFQSGQEEVNKSNLLGGGGGQSQDLFTEGPGGIPIDINPGALAPTIGGVARVLGHGNIGAPVGAAVEAGSGNRQAGSIAEVGTNLATLAAGLSPRLLAKLPSGIARQMTSVRKEIDLAKKGIEAAKGALPGATEKAVEGASRLGGTLMKDLSQTNVGAQPSKLVTKVGKALENVETNATTASGARSAATRAGLPTIKPAHVPADLVPARAAAHGKETALVDFGKWINKAKESLNPKTQEAAIERAIKLIDKHFPGTKLPELDELRALRSQIASGKEKVLELGSKSAELGRKLEGRQASIRRLGKVGFGLYGLDRLSGAISGGLSKLSKAGGPQ